MLGAFNIVCICRRCLTLSRINLGMSHKMLFYIRSMIYIDIECLQSCEAREKFTMLNAKDVYPRWQKSSIPKNMFYQSGPWLPSGCSKIVGQLLHSETITPTWMWWAGKLMLRFEFAQRSYHSYVFLIYMVRRYLVSLPYRTGIGILFLHYIIHYHAI